MTKPFRLMGISAVLLMPFLVSISPSVADDAIQEVCSKGLYQEGDPVVQIVGRLGHLIEIVQGDGKVLYRAYRESRDQMGNVANKVSCAEDVRYFENLIVIRMGSQNDQLQAYGLNRNKSGKVVSLQQLIWNPRKSTIRTDVRRKAGAMILRATNGQNRNVKNTFCWTPGKFWSYASGGKAPCNKIYDDQRNIAVP